MSNDIRLDLLLKEIDDLYVQENFRKLKRYLDSIEANIGDVSTSVTNSIIQSTTTFYKNDIVVDAPFIISREITLSQVPDLDSERIFLNGLILADNCYTILGNILTLDGALDIEVGDDIFVRYAS